MPRVKKAIPLTLAEIRMIYRLRLLQSKNVCGIIGVYWDDAKMYVVVPNKGRECVGAKK